MLKTPDLDMEQIIKVDEELNSASIETLPDDLLIHILSFLPMKEAALTSTLFKRWWNLFAFSHNFDFDDPFDSFYRNRGRWNKIVNSFWGFMSRILSMEEDFQSKKLSIKFNNIDPEIIIDFWNHQICNALKHGVSELHIHINFIVCHLSTVFNSTRLVKLSLGRLFIINTVPSDTYLPSLKVLLFDEIGFKHAQLAQLFFAACPALEDLTINELHSGGCSYTISSTTIKKLSFSNRDYYRDNSFVSFDTPNVVDLCYYDHPRLNSTKYSGFDSLVKTRLDLKGFGEGSLYEPDVEYVKNLIIGIRNVKTLHLTDSTIEVIVNMVSCKDVILVFNNLVYLQFSSDKKGLRVLLPRLIERSPNLRVLVLFLSVLDRYIFRKRRRFVRILSFLEKPNRDAMYQAV